VALHKDVYIYKISLSGDYADKLVTLHNENDDFLISMLQS